MTVGKRYKSIKIRVTDEELAKLNANEVKATAKSIAKYCWKHDQRAEQEFSQKQAKRGALGGKASGVTRAKANEDKRIQARLLSAKGMSQRAIAKELAVSVGSINSWLKN